MKCFNCNYDDNGTGDSAHLCEPKNNTLGIPKDIPEPLLDNPNMEVSKYKYQYTARD